jgi:hypothetical protein
MEQQQQLTPEQAFNNVAQICEKHLLDGPNRRAVDESLRVLADVLKNIKEDEELKREES